MIPMKRIITIMRKEWAQVFKNRLVLSTIIFMPMLFTAIPLVMLVAMGGTDAVELTSDLPPQYTQFCPDNLSGNECMQVFTVNQFMLLFMITPLIIPINIAAYSIVGEKTSHSLEPLLATPISTAELLIGKNIAAVIPAVLATWLGFLLYVLGAWIIVQSPSVVSTLLDPMWWLAVLVAGPLLAVLSVNFGLMISSRVTEPRVAEQISALVVLPLVGLFIAQVAGVFLINRLLVMLFCAMLILIDAGLVALAVYVFQRESILTRWK